ncbi:MAG: DUF177 domain-containing protein [Lachnospiraceae bacterium]|nr:DUF177 domain-containing protein [Lachnospiraceae bacterium]MEE1341241.1 DUF177 domain-containing protein [Lachnospiraceae bacterium]
MLINLSDILSVPEKEEHLFVELEFSKITFHGEEYSIVEKQPMELTLVNLGNQRLHLIGKLDCKIMALCSRCLEEVIIGRNISIDKEIQFEPTKEEEIEELSEMSFIQGFNLDVDLLGYCEVMLTLPTRVLCSEDCKGICSVCGKNRNVESCHCVQTVLDPRMAAIQDIFNNFKEV